MRTLVRSALRHRPWWLTAVWLVVAALLLLFANEQRHWRQRAAALALDNRNLQLRQLSLEIDSQSKSLLDGARVLAESDWLPQILQEGAASPQDRAAFAQAMPRAADAVVVISGAQTVRFSGRLTGDHFEEQPADPLLLKLLDSEGMAARAGRLEVIGDRWLVARPIVTHNAPAAAGWLVLSRALRPAFTDELSHDLGISVTGQPVREVAAGALRESLQRRAARPAGVRGPYAAPAGDGAAGNYVSLRDADGNAQWLFRLGADGESGLLDAPPERGEGMLADFGSAGSLLMVAVIALTGLVLKRYFRHQKSVDGRYKALIDQANDGIVIVDAASHRVLYTNPAFSTRLGYNADEAQTLSLTDIFADSTGSPETLLARLTDANSHMPMNIQQRCKSGACIDTEVRCNALDVDGRDVLAYVTHDVSLRRKAEQQLIENQQRLDRMAHHDQLTGLPNRHYLSTFLPQAIAEAKTAGTMLGVVFLDLDRFKHINDTRGHETGDKLLQEVASRLRACVRDSDVVIRMGGDEFVVIFRSVKSYEEVTQGAARIVETLNRPIIIDQHPLQTTGSVGVSLYPRDGQDMVELLKHSDTAMYQAKDRGRNNVQMFSQVMNRKLKQRVAVEASLREALRLKQLDVHFQPFVNLHTRKIVGLEALMRWCHPLHGMVPADQFIPVAEETGLIVPMGNFVLHRTLQIMSAWRKAGVALVPVSLNVASAQLQRGELLSTMATLLKSHAIRPEMLQLEMTERAVFDSHSPAGENRQDTMARLRDLGIKIAIDDFGTGYSSLSYLKNWRVDALKIDRSFVRDLVTDSSDLAIVSAIIAIAKHLRIQVIAEGIEGYQQAEILRRLGCAVGQGFLFARPMPAEQMLQLLRADSGALKEEEEDMLAAFSSGTG